MPLRGGLAAPGWAWLWPVEISDTHPHASYLMLHVRYNEAYYIASLGSSCPL
jgi:hypothetical protein